MPSCNDLVTFIPDYPEGYSNLLYNADFAPYPSPRHPDLDPWAAVRDRPPAWRVRVGTHDPHSRISFEPTGGLLGTGKLVIEGEVSLFQRLWPFKFMPYDDDYREGEGLHANNDICRALYMICSGQANVRLRVSVYGRTEPIETEAFIAPSGSWRDDPTRPVGFEIADWRAHYLRYWDEPTEELLTLESVDVQVTTSAEFQLSCLYLPGIDASATGMVRLPDHALAPQPQPEKRIDDAAEPDGGEAAPWPEALRLQLGAYMVRTESKLDRVMGALKVAGLLDKNNQSPELERTPKTKKPVEPKRTSKCAE